MAQEPERLTDAELERESAAPLPDREAMSTLNPDLGIVDLELEPYPQPQDELEPQQSAEDL
jgi:hypothetical protein